MIHSLAPAARGFNLLGWVLVILLSGTSAEVMAQGDASKKSSDKKTGKASAKVEADKPAAKGDSKKAAAKGEEAKAAAEAEEAVKEEEAPVETASVEIFIDPRAEAALSKLKSIPGWRPGRPADFNAVKAMAAGQSNIDAATVQRFVEGMAEKLVDSTNIKDLTSPPEGAITRSSLNIQNAVDGLIDVLNIAKATNNAAFLKTYDPIVLSTLSKLLDNHLVSRIQAMIVIGQLPTADILPVVLTQLKDKDQTIWVKLWAMKALSNVTGEGVNVTSVLGADRAYTAARAVLECIEAEDDMAWPAKMRAMEAIGALRQSAGPAARDKAEIATAAMSYLANPDLEPEVRSGAAWALGMIQVNPSISKYNYTLIGFWIGTLSADLGQSIVEGFEGNKTDSEYLTGMLVGPISQAFNGKEGARESGLLNLPSNHPNVGPSLTYLRQISDLETNMARAAVDLIRSPKGLVPDKLKVMSTQLGALQAFLDKNPPKDFHLIPPDGPEFPRKAPEVETPPAEAETKGADKGGN